MKPHQVTITEETISHINQLVVDRINDNLSEQRLAESIVNDLVESGFIDEEYSDIIYNSNTGKLLEKNDDAVQTALINYTLQEIYKQMVQKTSEISTEKV